MMAVSAVSRTCSGVFLKLPGLCGSNLSKSIWPLGYRQLYTPAALGLTHFISLRERTAIQFNNMKDKFLERMMQLLATKDSCMIFTEDLKNIVHLAEASDTDLSLVLEMSKKFQQQHQGLRFGAFVFGPVVMRMYHHLNQPDAALEALQTKELEGFFDQMISYQLLMDLLYDNERYQDALDVFELLQEKRIAGVKYPKPCFTIAIAACVKINTQESLTNMLKLFESAEEYGLKINRRLITYGATLALRQNHPHFALEFLGKSYSLNHIAVRTLKVMALCELNRVEDIFPILRSIIQIDLPVTTESDKQFHILNEAMVVAENAVRETGKKEVIAEFESILRSLQENNIISDKTLDMLLSEPIDKFKPQDPRTPDRAMLAASFYGKSRDRRPRWNNSHRRQGLADTE